MHTRPTADATRRQYSRNWSNVRNAAGRGPSRRRLSRPRTASSEVEGRHVRGGRPLRRARLPAFEQAASSSRHPATTRPPRASIPRWPLPRPLVHIIVNRPAEVPHGDDGAALGIREHHERIVEIRVAAGHGCSGGLGRLQEIAFHRRAGMSAVPRVGLAVKTSNPISSRRSRMRMPPSHVSRSS